MGKRGPKPLPTTIKLLRGNPSNQPLNDKRPIAGGTPTCPAWLPAYGKQVWRRVLGAMPPGIYTSADVDILAAYCQACVQHKLAVERLEEEGYFTASGVHQAAWAVSNASNTIAKLGSLLGLNPSARDQLKMPNGLSR